MARGSWMIASAVGNPVRSGNRYNGVAREPTSPSETDVRWHQPCPAASGFVNTCFAPQEIKMTREECLGRFAAFDCSSLLLPFDPFAPLPLPCLICWRCISAQAHGFVRTEMWKLGEVMSRGERVEVALNLTSREATHAGDDTITMPPGEWHC